MRGTRAWARGKPSEQELEDLRLLKEVGGFDESFYLDSVPSAAGSRMDPALHYLTLGEKTGGKPCELFDPVFYLAANPDVADAGVSPFVHYCSHGWREQRNPSAGFDAAGYASRHMSAEERETMPPLRHYQLFGKASGFSIAHIEPPAVDAIRCLGVFDESRYLTLYPDVAESGWDAALHYVTHGSREGRSPCEGFDSGYYLEANPDVAASDENALLHFMRDGWHERRNPSADFDVAWYVGTYLDGCDEINPLVDYLERGRLLRRSTRRIEDTSYAIIEKSGLFDRAAYIAAHADVADSGMDPLLHYLLHGSAEGRSTCDRFDDRYYLSNNPDVAACGKNPLAHFCETGWKELRNPSARFDVWWYWSNYMDPRKGEVNPLLHYLQEGASKGHEPRPASIRRAVNNLAPGGRGSAVRRICLFAGYDKDGLIDDCVVAYIRELSRHADVYYFADCEMRDGELDKLAGIAKGAWAERHGAYDFGSYAALAVDRLGWDALEGYDEVLFANDSCYLLRDLDDVFAKMDSRPCDWWGLQATKGISATRHAARNRFRDPIPMGVVTASLLGEFEKDYTYDFLVGSYFVAFRRDVVNDAGFRKLVSSAVPQESKKNVILKYEVGLTRYLVSRGYTLETFMDHLYPFHPVFSGWYFCMLEQGFPLLKRLLITDNHYGVPGLHDWADRIREKLPDCDIGSIQRNLARVAGPERLELSLGTDARPGYGAPELDRIQTHAEFAALDMQVRKLRNWWAFPVCGFTRRFSGNERAVFEEVRDDPAIRKIVFTRDIEVEVDGSNVDVVPLESVEGQRLLLQCGTVFIRHSVPRNVKYPIACDLRNVINLWHGIPLKRIGYASVDQAERLAQLRDEHRKYRAVISSSEVDRMAMGAAFYPLSYEDIWMTGLPRVDFILRDIDRLPSDLRRECDALSEQLAGRKLVMFVPTFRNGQDSAYYEFSNQELARLAGWLEKNNAVLGIREHMADTARSYSRSLRLEGLCLDLSEEVYPNIEVVYRAASLLITDYSSCFMDFMVTGRPAISFAYDEHHYQLMERGFFYKLEEVFPGPVCRSFEDLMSAMERVFDPAGDIQRQELEWKRRQFFHYVDDSNSRRVVEQVKRISDRDSLGGVPQVRWGLE